MGKRVLEVFQANSFIESRQHYTVNEKRLLSTIISFVKPSDTEFVEYYFSIVEWADLTGKTKENFYQIADSVTDGLMSKIVKIDRLDENGNKAFKKFHIMSTADYEAGKLTLKISNDMNNIFLQLRDTRNYTHYELVEFVTLTSTHAQRIYELVKQYQHSKQRQRKIKISDLKEMLGIENKYKEFKDFRKYVLNIALKQIEAHTSLRYQWKGIKRGRSFNEILFYEISIAGKDNPTELQEKAFLENYGGQEIYNEKFNTYFTIKTVSKLRDKSYAVIDTFDNIEYNYLNMEEIQKSIAKAQTQKLF